MNLYPALRHLIPLILYLASAPILSAQENLDSLMLSYGLVDIQTLAPGIRVNLKYATTDNFLGEKLYRSLSRAFLQPVLAKALAQAQEILSREKPGYRFRIYDAARPLSAQRKMYAKVAGTPLSIYVASPKHGGRHNYGAAVDLTIENERGEALDMGSSFDHFGEEAHPGQEKELTKKGIFTQNVLQNRALLRRILGMVGLRPYQKEWWHYQERISMAEVRRRYRLLDF